jgi:hypothetical protein
MKPQTVAVTADAFDTAELYDCRDSEFIDHTSPAEAIAELIENDYMERDADVRQLIREKVGSVTVVAYRSKDITDEWIGNEAERLLELAQDDYYEEHGEGSQDFLPDLNAASVELDMVALLKRLYGDDRRIWDITQVGQRTYDADAIEALMREERPEWFEEAA